MASIFTELFKTVFSAVHTIGLAIWRDSSAWDDSGNWGDL